MIDESVICRFRFVCTQKWADLEIISGESDKRYCCLCNESVYVASNYDELASHIADKRCVVVFVQRPGKEHLEVMGDVSAPRDPTDPFLLKRIDEFGHIFDEDSLNVSKAAIDVLKAHGLILIGDLVISSHDRLEEIFCDQHELLNQIKEVLASYGFRVGTFLPGWDQRSAPYRVCAT